MTSMTDKSVQDLIHPVIMSGGAGSRLWPLSRQLYPKQLLPLAGERTMIQETAKRVEGPQFATPMVVCNQEHRFLIAEQLRESRVGDPTIVLEPVGRNTAPVAAVAALLLAQKDPGALILLMPADHVVEDTKAFAAAVEIAAAAAREGAIATFGIEPRGPETGYGYIQRGAATALKGAWRVKRFVEKPDREQAQSYIDSGDHYWNSGIFMFRAKAYLDELEKFEPQIAAQCRDAVAKGKRDLDFFRLDAESFTASPSKSIDYAVMEHTQHAAIVPVAMGWNDVGSWQSLWEIAARDNQGNASEGDVVALNVANSYLRSEGPLLAAVGVEDVVVVATQDAVLVTRRGATQDVKKIVEEIERSGRHHHLHHRQVFRPWGSYDSIDYGDRFQVKRIVVNPGAKLSLQMHHHRAEHWVVVSGTAKVTCNDKVFLLKENESTFIPLGATHRLENPGAIPLHLIEVQSGAYLGEDDIVRFEDRYGR
ncbi:MAG TPA: mannose-1-phosphate guanylyltransferase/mannose-6-phosphate isomerase [Rhizomicrobium sp.]|nr:mannose-1-phosphate guanylyltransferase/mannose-6-phosphate isomerase [Rhizomicrobium sp.]